MKKSIFPLYLQHSNLICVFISEIIIPGEMTVKLNANEIVLKAGDTNQVIDNQKVDGKLIVTNQRIYFKTLSEVSDRFNFEILFENILEVIFYNKNIFLVKGINVITRDGKSHSFPLKKRDEIGQLINRMY
ncbi:MAG: hypothetical protein MUO72_05780 [Bacteroidales bacterium]|nr:hypothetical protein [Bacteroidales bacterium]